MEPDIKLKTELIDSIIFNGIQFHRLHDIYFKLFTDKDPYIYTYARLNTKLKSKLWDMELLDLKSFKLRLS